MNTSRLRTFLLFIRYLGSSFYQDNCTRTASALSYTTLLSLVPLLAVVFAILSSFPQFVSLADEAQAFIFSNFVPASGEQVQTHFRQFIETAASMGSVGLFFLLLTAVMLMNTINVALNDIWQVAQQRNFFSSLLIYAVVLIFGPILIAASILLTSYVVSIPLIAEAGESVGAMRNVVLSVAPFFATMVALLLLYVVVPNCRVSWRAGMVAAVVAALLFELAKKGFAWYVLAFPTYTVIYGALAVIPVFLVWIYVSWLVLLLGAEIARCLTTFKPDNREDDVV